MFWDAASYESQLLPPSPPGGNLTPGGHSKQCRFRPVLAEAPARIALKLRIRPMGVDVLEDLVTSGHLAPELVKQMPTFTVASYEARYLAAERSYQVRDTFAGDCSAYRCMLDPSDGNCN
jgi:hypothetical protein